MFLKLFYSSLTSQANPTLSFVFSSNFIDTIQIFRIFFGIVGRFQKSRRIFGGYLTVAHGAIFF